IAGRHTPEVSHASSIAGSTTGAPQRPSNIPLSDRPEATRRPRPRIRPVRGRTTPLALLAGAHALRAPPPRSDNPHPHPPDPPRHERAGGNHSRGRAAGGNRQPDDSVNGS